MRLQPVARTEPAGLLSVQRARVSPVSEGRCSRDLAFMPWGSSVSLWVVTGEQVPWHNRSS